MQKTIKICNDEFRIKYQGNFKSRPDLTWTIAYVADNQVLVAIPFEYGENEAQKLLETKYFFNYMKSIVDQLFYVFVKDYPDEVMIAELEKL